MKIEVLGSGGAVRTPKPFCNCTACLEARIMGARHQRLGPSVYVHGPNILIDTPEDIFNQVNRSKITEINAILYSHWHPDHTAGRRLFEMNIDWKGVPAVNRKTTVVLTEKIKETFISCMSIMDSFNYYQTLGIVDLVVVGNSETLTVYGCLIKPIQLQNDYVFGYVFDDGNEKILVIMDEMKGWIPTNDIIEKCFNIAYLPFGLFDKNPFTNERLIPEIHPLLENEQTIDETVTIINTINARKFVLSHIEEPDNITFDLGEKLAKYYSSKTNKEIIIAYDGLVI